MTFCLFLISAERPSLVVFRFGDFVLNPFAWFAVADCFALTGLGGLLDH